VSAPSRDDRDRVRDVFAALGLPLAPRHACGERAIAAAEKRAAVVGRRFSSKLGRSFKRVGQIGARGVRARGHGAVLRAFGRAEWRLFAAAHDARVLDRLAKRFSLRWDPHFGEPG